MEIFLRSFISTYNKKSQLSYLLNGQPVTVCFQTNVGDFAMSFFNGKSSLITGLVNNQTPAIVLKGSIETMRELLSGNQKLREAIAQNKLSLSTNFRTILLLESIFYLTYKGIESELIC